MSIPIQSTPNIKEKDAEKFYKLIEENENKISNEIDFFSFKQYLRIMENLKLN